MKRGDAQARGEPAPRRPRRRPPRSRYGLAALLVMVGLASGVAVALAAGSARGHQAGGFARASVPGDLTFRVEHAGTFYVYAEDTICLDFPDCHGELYPVTVRVTDPAGHGIPVTTVNGPGYMRGGTGGTAVARFEATRTGAYRIAVATGTIAEGRFAVGPGFPAWTDDRFAWALTVVLAGAGAVLAAATLIRRRRAGVGSGHS